MKLQPNDTPNWQLEKTSKQEQRKAFMGFQQHEKHKPKYIAERLLTTALKRVDFPTLGRPTMPALRLMLILEEENRLPLPNPPPITPTISW